MKKRILTILCAGMLVLQVTGCGAKETTENQTETTETTEETQTEASAESTKLYFSEIDVDNNVVLGEYMNLEVVQTQTTVTEEEVESYIQYMLSMSKQQEEVTDRDVVENGDIANIDYVGKKDGVAFDGGTAQGYNLTIGSGSFIPGFEEGLVGVKKGETVDLNLTFPENYQAADLAGAEVVFTVTVNGIYEQVIPEFTDEFVANLAIEGVSTAEDYRAYAKKMLQESADQTSKQNLQTQIMTMATQNAQIKEIPQELIEKFQNVSMDNVNYQAMMYGVDLETFVSGYYGVDLATFEQEMATAAEESAKQAMVCIKIAKDENIEITEEETDAIIEANYVSYGYESAESFKSTVDMEEYKDSLLLNKVVDFLVENAKITESATLSEQKTEDSGL